MSQAEELLETLTSDPKDIAAYIAGSEDEEHITIDENRIVNVPTSLRRIAVQYDHNVETVTFDCPRYWDERDLSVMYVYINYSLPSGQKGRCLTKNLRVDETDKNIIHFDWVITNDFTNESGEILFLVCAVQTDSEGNEEIHWNTEINDQLTVSKGIECVEIIPEEYPDIINDIFTRLDTVIADNDEIIENNETIIQNNNEINARLDDVLENNTTITNQAQSVIDSHNELAERITYVSDNMEEVVNISVAEANADLSEDLKILINDKIDNGYFKKSLEWEKGAIRTSVGTNDDSGTNPRIRTKGYLTLTKGSKIKSLSEDIQFYVFKYEYNTNNAENYIGHEEGYRSEYYFTENIDIRLMLKKVDGSEIVESDCQCLSIESPIIPYTKNEVELNNSVSITTKFNKKIDYINWKLGNTNGDIGSDYTAENRLISDFIKLDKGSIIYSGKSNTKFAIYLYDLKDRYYIGKGGKWFNYGDNYVIDDDCYVRLICAKYNDYNIDDVSIVNDIIILNNSYVKNKNDVRNQINIEYGRVNNTSYILARIPKILSNGEKLIPKVRLTTDDGTLNNTETIKSALNYSRKNNSILVINGGIFNTENKIPFGQTIIDGVSITNTPATNKTDGAELNPGECYPLCIDSNGDLSAPYDKMVDTSTMIEDGIVQAVTGWIKIIDNYEICNDDIRNETVHYNECLPQQIIGQFQNGDYFVFTSDGQRGNVQNENGMTYMEIATILNEKGVKFAYALDGGGSTETVLGLRPLNPVYEGLNGRYIPGVIEFVIE